MGFIPISDDYALGVLRVYDAMSPGNSEGCNPPKPKEELDVEDAFVEQDGDWFYAIQGNNGRKLKRFSKKSEAEDYVDFLHRKNKPGSGNKGANARKKVQAQEREKEK